MSDKENFLNIIYSFTELEGTSFALEFRRDTLQYIFEYDDVAVDSASYVHILIEKFSRLGMHARKPSKNWNTVRILAESSSGEHRSYLGSIKWTLILS